MNNYPELEAKVREEAAKQFDESNPKAEGYQAEKAQRNERSRFIRDAVDSWFEASELYSSIYIRRDRYVEIRDCYYGSSITVYPPERTWDFEGGEQKVRIKPAYLNCSTWNTGDYKSTVASIHRQTKHYLKMVEIAVDVQNEMNSVLIEWNDVENPMKIAEWEKSELLRFRTERDERLQRESEKKANKLAKSSK